MLNKKIMSAAMAAMMTVSCVAFADSSITVNVNNQKVIFDQEPYIENERTMVPMRAIFEALGAEVTWDEATKSVASVKDDTVVVLQIGQNKIFVNGTAKEMDTVAVITGDRTMVPLRAVSEAFHCVVDWNGDTRTVDITTNDANASASAQLPNPVKNYSSAANLNLALEKYSVALLADTSYEPQEYRCYNGQMAEITYKKNDSEVTVRTARFSDMGMKDISGIYGGSELETYKLNDSEVAINRYEDTLYAVWTCVDVGEEYAHCVTLTNGTSDELKALVQDTEDNHPRG